VNLVADESVDQQIVARLRHEQHTVLAIAETMPGITDEVVLAETATRNAVLLTADLADGVIDVGLRVGPRSVG